MLYFTFYILGKKLADNKCLGGRGRLTIAKCDAIQNFYGRAIRDNKNNSAEMSRATWAILQHYSSTADNPKHNDCPDGTGSWCSYKRDEVSGLKTHVPTKDPLTDAMVEAMTPLFHRLTDQNFLEGCKDCYTQNSNESLNHVIWSLAPKEQFVSEHETTLAIILGVCIFNDGLTTSLKDIFYRCDLDCLEDSVNRWKSLDNERIQTGNLGYRILGKK